jgi:hypothetical protein
MITMREANDEYERLNAVTVDLLKALENETLSPQAKDAVARAKAYVA